MSYGAYVFSLKVVHESLLKQKAIKGVNHFVCDTPIKTDIWASLRENLILLHANERECKL